MAQIEEPHGAVAASSAASVADGRGLLAAADDAGSVRLLDPRQRSPRCQLAPAKSPAVARPGLGDWLTCLACRSDSADWLACGGGPRLAIWHTANLAEPVAVAATESDAFAPMCAEFAPTGDRLLAGGNAPLALQFSAATGALVASSAVASAQVLSIGCLRPAAAVAAAAAPAGVGDGGCGDSGDSWRLTACGLGPSADVCSSLGYRLFSLSA